MQKKHNRTGNAFIYRLFIWIFSKSSSIRALYGTNEQRNAVHGSDSAVSAEREIRFFFPNCKSMKMQDLVSSWFLSFVGIVEPIPTGQPAKDYLEQNVNKTLIKALTALCKEKPNDPVVKLINYH